jgi:ApaG protein
MVVHHVEVDQVRARADNVANLVAEAGEIRGENARCDTVLRGSHGTRILRGKTVLTSGMGDMKKYSVAVTAHSTYLPDQSDEEEDRYVFAYTIRITNNGDVPAQLVSRHWIITDADNQVQEVRGMGVVGEQPVLKPGDTFEYSSGSSIPTAVGTMRGTYQLVAEDGTRFEAPIPEFTLSVPRILH